MATYIYNCPACEEEKVVVKSMTDNTLQVCADCGDAALRRVYTAPGVSFKGSGFYSTDN